MARNARFWEWVNGAWVKITLRPEQELTHCTTARTDEGFHGAADTWTHDGDSVSRTVATWGRDCDGRYEHEYTACCDLNRLAAAEGYEGQPKRPDWQDERQWQRDHTAEAAGY
jgi:hypothetical protein